MFASKVIIASKSFIVRQGLLQTIHNVQTGILPVEVAAFDELITQIKTMIKGLILIDTDLIEPTHTLPLNEAIQDLPGIHVLMIQRNNPTEISEKLDFQTIHLDLDQEKLEESIRSILQTEAGEESERSQLSERELEIVKKVALGYTNKEISEALFISPHTVITHRKNITAKLGIKTISGLTVYALLNNMLSADDLQQTNKTS